MFRKSEIALGLLLLTTGVAAIPMRAELSATEVLIQRARTLDGQGRHDLAAAAWQQVLLLNPDQADALAALATFYQSNGDTTLANHYMALLRKAKPGDAKLAQIPATRSGNTSDFEAAAKLASQHRYQESLELYRKAFHGTEPSGMWAVSYYETEAAVPAELAQAITGLRGLVRPGNSGGPLIDASGHVVGMIFAEETDAPAGRPAGFAVPGPVVAADYAQVRNSDTTVSSGSCAD